MSNVTVGWRARQVVLSLTMMDPDICANINSIHVNRVNDRVMCVQTTGNNAPCAGNLGSGLYCGGIFTGMLTRGIGCNATPAIFQQVRAYNRWIEEQFTRNDLPREAGTVPFNVEGISRNRRL